MAYKIRVIDGIGEDERTKLERIGIRTTADLLRRCASAAGRIQVAGDTGIEEGRLVAWVAAADLMRISGVGSEYAELLDAAGVKTLGALRSEDPNRLAARLREANARRRLARALPSVHRVARWIEQANALHPTVAC